MPDDSVTVSLRDDSAEAPATTREAPWERPDAPAKERSGPERAPRPPGRYWMRWGLFLLLPLLLLAGGYWYVTGGQIMSTDDAYVEADKVGVSTDVSGIVKAVDVTENQHVEASEVLYRLDDLPFQLALRRAEAQVGISVVNSLLTENTQVNHANIAQHVTSVNRLFESPTIAQFWNPVTDAGRAALDAMITQQAQFIAYIDDYKLLMIATLAAIPLLVVFSTPPRRSVADHAVVIE